MNEATPDRASGERLSEWVRQHGRAVRGYVLGMVRNEDAADDVTQDVFRRAWQARDSYRDEGRPRAYLLKIADRLALDYLRRLGREVNLDEESWGQWEPATAEAAPEAALGLAERAGEVRQALERLSPLQKRVLLLRFYGQMEFVEIAATLGCPLNTALSHCHRGLLALRKFLAD
ncbi:MAG: RNA polymerase sigma factor [Pirellulales bacterium]